MISVSFQPDGAARQCRLLREHLCPVDEQHWLRIADASPAALLRGLYLAWRHAPSCGLLLEQPPPAWAVPVLRLLAKKFTLEIYANRWPRRGERIGLPHARWWFPTARVAEAWQSAGVVAKQANLSPAYSSTDKLAPSGPRPLRDAAPTILWAGPLGPGPGAYQSAWSFDILSQVRPDVRLLIAGSGPHEAKLRRFIANMPLRSRMLFEPTLEESHWSCVTLVWVNDGSVALPDVWIEAVHRQLPCLVASPHSATGWRPALPTLPWTDAPAWAQASLARLPVAAAA